MSMAKITFCGGAGTVTGANFLFDTGKEKILIDCGSQSQEYTCDDVNFAAFSYQPHEITALIVTHAHADHIGRIPKLVRDGFRGAIYSTHATKEISAVMFEDAVKIMRDEVTRHGCDMLYETEHTERALALWQGREYHETFEVGAANVELLDAGHVLGSAMVKLSRLRQGSDGQALERSIVFTGDLGNSPEPLLNDTESPAGANYIVMESVYGDRIHEGRAGRTARLRKAIEETHERKGVLIIPSFSIERTQVLLYEINEMVEHGGLESVPVFLDAPLGTRITDVFKKYPKLFNPEAQKRFGTDADLFSFPGLKVIRNTGESRDIHKEPNPKVIIAGAGMSGGGRVRAHERESLGSPDTMLLFVGYQAPGTLGRRIEDGAKHVSIDGADVHVCARIYNLTGYSGHADRDQLLQFVENARESLEKVFVTMGEPKSSMFLAQRIKDFLNVEARVPEQNETVDIDW